MSEARRQTALMPRPNWGARDPGAQGQGRLQLLPGACGVPHLRGQQAGEVRHLGRAERGRALVRAPSADAPGQRGLTRAYGLPSLPRAAPRGLPGRDVV